MGRLTETVTRTVEVADLLRCRWFLRAALDGRPKKEKTFVTQYQSVRKLTLDIIHWVHPSPGLPGLDARFWTRGEETGVSIVSTFTSGMGADRSVEARAVLASFSWSSLVISVPLFFSEFFTAGSNFWAIISCNMKTNKNLTYVPSGKIYTYIYTYKIDYNWLN